MNELIDFVVLDLLFTHPSEMFVIGVLFISALVMWSMARNATTKKQHIKYWFLWVVFIMTCFVQIGKLIAIL